MTWYGVFFFISRFTRKPPGDKTSTAPPASSTPLQLHIEKAITCHHYCTKPLIAELLAFLSGLFPQSEGKSLSLEIHTPHPPPFAWPGLQNLSPPSPGQMPLPAATARKNFLKHLHYVRHQTTSRDVTAGCKHPPLEEVTLLRVAVDAVETGEPALRSGC